MKKVHVDSATCFGCGACISITDKYFDWNEAGYSTAIKEEVAPEDEQVVEEAAACCPVDAIKVEEVNSENEQTVE